MVKVLYISPNGYLGGAERFVLTAASGHKFGSHIESAILFFSNGEACEEAHRLGIITFILKKSFRLRSPLKLLMALIETRRQVISYNPDVLHLTMPYSHIVVSLATMGLGIKKVWFQHGPVGGRLDQIANLFPVDMIWYNSNDLMNRHHETWPRAIVRHKESIINLGVSSNKYAHKLFLSSTIKIGAAGRICSWKGFHNIITALGELKKETELRPYNFVIAGSVKSSHDSEYRKELGDLVRGFNLTEEIKFLDHVENMEDFYQGLDVFVHSSIIPEPFGLVVAEAMINGCLVIGSDSGGVSDLLQDEKTGISFPSTKDTAVKELKKILKDILGEEGERGLEHYAEIAAQGRKFVEENYSVDKMINQMEILYLQLLREKSK